MIKTKPLKYFFMFSLVAVNFGIAEAQTTGKQLPGRDEIDEKYKWNLADIYESEQHWENDFNWLSENIAEYRKYEGKLGQSAKMLEEMLAFDEEVSVKIGKLHLYAMLGKDLDMLNPAGLARYDKIMQLYSRTVTAGSYIKPEILEIPRKKLESFIQSSEKLKVYQHNFDNIYRNKPYTLGKSEEEILSMAGEIMQVPSGVYSVLKNAELPMPVITNPEGEDIQLSAGRYMAAMYSPDRAYREKAFKEHNLSYKAFGNTFSTLLSGVVKVHVFTAKTRKFESCLAASLNSNNIPVDVYNNLVQTVNENLAPLHRWARLRKKALGLTELHPYDAYVTLFPASRREYSYNEALEIVEKSIVPLGADYSETLKMAFDNRWVDVYETKGKRGGAYSSGTTVGVHPYVLLNWNNQLNDVFTLAHEMGHNMHSYYTGKHQPVPYADYSIFVAEVASTLNEALLLDYLIENAKSKEEKLSLLEHYITNINTTFYRQTMFAEFEKIIHEKVERGEALSSDGLSVLFKEIAQKFWGPDMVVDDEEAWAWARIPHFYYNFYVYQYATSFAASQVLLQKIKTEGQPAINRYLEFLKSGNSDYAINTLIKAGVDMTSPEPVLNTIKKMDELMDEMERLMETDN